MKRQIFFVNPHFTNDKGEESFDYKDAKLSDFQILRPGTLISANHNNKKIDGIIIDSAANIQNSNVSSFEAELHVSAERTEKVKLRFNQFSVTFPSHKISIPHLLIPDSKFSVENFGVIKEVDEKMMRFIIDKPEILNSMHPAAFEDLIKKIYHELNYEVSSVGKWNQADGGVDLFAIKSSNEFGDIKFAIQCKRSKNKVQSRIIRELNGVLEHNKCNFGIVATSSYFTKDAVALTSNELWKIKLNDRDKILENLELIFK